VFRKRSGGINAVLMLEGKINGEKKQDEIKMKKTDNTKESNNVKYCRELKRQMRND